MKINSSTEIWELYPKISVTRLIFLHSKKNLLFFYILVLLINLCVVAAMLPIMEKLSVILKSECVKSLEFLLLLEREWTGITILP